MTDKLIKLREEQCKVLYLPEKGTTVIKGVAGSGKSLEAIYRAILLSITVEDKIYLFAYNNKVVQKMIKDKIKIIKKLEELSEDETLLTSSHLKEVSNKIIITTSYNFLQQMFNKYFLNDPRFVYNGQLKDDVINEISSFPESYDVVQKIGSLPFKALTEQESLNLINELIESTCGNRPADFLDRYDNSSVLAYIKKLESGVPSDIEIGEDKKYLDQLVKLYQNTMIQGFNINNKYKYFDFRYIYYYADEIAAKMQPNDKIKFMVIHEAQDFSPQILRAMNKFCADGVCKLILGDQDQNIFYQDSTVLMEKADWNIELKNNYRNPLIIARLATNVRKGDLNQKINELDEKVKIYHELQLLDTKTWWDQTLEKKMVVIYFGERKRAKEYVRRNLKALYPTDYNERFNNIDIISILKVKGLEYDLVAIYGFDTFIYDHDKNEFKFKSQSVSAVKFVHQVYVAITRAKEKLAFISTTEGNFPDIILNKDWLDWSSYTTSY